MSTKRRNEMWISNNRVLVGSSKKVTGRNPNFDTEETKVLISLWGDPKVQKTLITTHKKHAVIAKLADKMREFGYYRSPEEINTRIKNLKCFYNRIKKDMEYGVSAIPTWKHYAAMDEIMTRPIFSVRPNEIPKPSLRYRLEEEMKEREEKEKEEKEKEREREKEEAAKAAAATGSRKTKKSGSDGDEEDDDEDGDDDEEDDDDEDDMDDEVDDVSFTQEMFEDEINTEEMEKKKIKPEETSRSSDVEETPLIIPKEEPIDVDEEPERINNSRENSAILNDNKIKTALNEMKTSSSPVIASANSIKMPHLPLVATPNSIATVFTNQQAHPISSQAGKISLVPTNLLLKPQSQQQIQIRPQPQHRIIYTKSAGAVHQASPTAGIMTSAVSTAAPGAQQVPMKVLLVNTLQKSSTSNTNIVQQQQQQSVTNIATTLQKTQNNISRTINSITHNNSSNSSSGHSIPIPEKRQKLSSSSKSSKEGSSFRSLLSQLVRLHSQNLEVNKQRLDIEKQRFDFEKSIAEKFLNAFLSQQSVQKSPVSDPLATTFNQNQLSSPSQTQSQSQSQVQPQVPSSPTTPVNNDSTIPLLIPKVEKVDDGYEN